MAFSFPVSTPLFSNMLEGLLNEPGNVFKGQYLDIQLPFRQGKSGSDYFPNLPMQYPPLSTAGSSWDELPARDTGLNDIDLGKVDEFMKLSSATGRRNFKNCKIS